MIYMEVKRLTVSVETSEFRIPFVVCQRTPGIISQLPSADVCLLAATQTHALWVLEQPSGPHRVQCLRYRMQASSFNVGFRTYTLAQ